jgi:Metallo-peptidase family M12B Reprolysin-like
MRVRLKAVVVAVFILNCPRLVLPQTQSFDSVWRKLEFQRPVQMLDFQPLQGPEERYSSFSLSQERIGAILRTAPKEFTQEAESKPAILTIPFPDGRFERFRIEASPIIDKPLESKGFETTTYKGTGIDDPSATIRFEHAFDGFHAVVRSAHGVFYIDPTNKETNREKQGPYVSYFASARSAPVRTLHCEVSSERARKNRNPRAQARPAGGGAKQPVSIIPAGLRTYRLALAVNSSYVDAVYHKELPVSRFDQAAAALQRTVNRINEIYESELGIRLTLVSNESKLIYTDPDTDPYIKVNADPDGALSVNQLNLDNVIGSGNYDIGHVFTTKTAGLAEVASVCSGNRKAKGVTGMESPKGDEFDVDYVSHEIGHQFGADHTFNAITQSCNGNRYADTAYEPGSGSTIMGYAGICDPESLQEHSDAYFHLASLLEVVNYVTNTASGTGGSCGTLSPLAFGVPTFPGPGSYTIPKGTPFLLSLDLKSGSPNVSTFNWEEFDLGDPAPPDDESGPPTVPRPLFRSKTPDLNRFRFFPDFESLIRSSGTPTLGETMPFLDRTMRFRFTGRNSHGGFTYVEIPVKIDPNSGPFKIVSASGGNDWARGSVHKIQWDVARTNIGPINCAQIRAFLAIGGNPGDLYEVAKGIPNSGSYDLLVPLDAPLSNRSFLILAADNNIFLTVYPFALQITSH